MFVLPWLLIHSSGPVLQFICSTLFIFQFYFKWKEQDLEFSSAAVSLYLTYLPPISLSKALNSPYFHCINLYLLSRALCTSIKVTCGNSWNSFWYPTENQWEVRTQKCRVHFQQSLSNTKQIYNFTLLHLSLCSLLALTPAPSFSLISLNGFHSFVSPPGLCHSPTFLLWLSLSFVFYTPGEDSLRIWLTLIVIFSPSFLPSLCHREVSRTEGRYSLWHVCTSFLDVDRRQIA